MRRLVVVAALLAGVGVVMAEAGDIVSRPVSLGQQVTFRSPALGEERTLLVATPTGYDSSGLACPVLYVLDGDSQFLHSVASADVLARTGEIPPLIVVGVRNVDRHRDFTAVARPDAASGGAPAFLRFLGDEVVPLVERSFRTVPHRTLVGHSLGALLAVHAAIERPALFSALVLVSPAISADERELPAGLEPVSRRLARALAQPGRRPLEVVTTMSGVEDQRWRDDLVLLRAALAAAPAVTETFVELVGESHGTTVVPSTYGALKTVFRGWGGREVAEATSLAAVRAHYHTLGERLGFAVEPPEDLLNRLGYHLLAAGDGPGAIAVLEANVALRPSSPNVHDSLGEALERQGRLPGALRSYREACRLAAAAGDPNLATFEQHRDRLEARLAEP